MSNNQRVRLASQSPEVRADYRDIRYSLKLALAELNAWFTMLSLEFVHTICLIMEIE